MSRKKIRMATIEEVLKMKFHSEKHRFLVNMVYTGNWMNNTFIEFLKPFRISPQQFNILRILRGAKDWVTMNKIKELMIDKSPNATRLADKLLDKGFVERKRCDEDRRVVFLKITEEGLSLLAEIDKVDNLVHDLALERITDEEAKLMCEIFDRIRG